MRTTGNNDCRMGGEKTRATGPIQIDFQQILGEVETTTSKIHAWISAQPVIEDDQGAKYMYMYWDGASELQTLQDELCLSLRRMVTFAAAMTKDPTAPMQRLLKPYQWPNYT